MPRKAQDKHVVKRDEIAELSNTKYELEFEDVEKVINKTEDKDETGMTISGLPKVAEVIKIGGRC